MLEHSVVGIYKTLSEAEAAVHSLQDGGVPIKQISVVANDLGDHRRLHGFAIACDAAKPAVVAGLWLGGIFGICVGAAFFWVPAFGPLFVAGSLASTMVIVFEGAVAGAGAIGALGWLAGLSVSKENIHIYELALKDRKILVIINGSAEVAHLAEDILSSSTAEQVDLHAPTI